MEWKQWDPEEMNVPSSGLRDGPIAIHGINYDTLTGEINERLTFWGCTYTGPSAGWCDPGGLIIARRIRPTHWLLLPKPPTLP